MKPENYLGLGLGFGALLGVLLDNIALWLPLGLAIGAGTMAAQTKKSDEEKLD